MSQKKTLLKYTKYVMGNRGIDSSRRIFLFAGILHTQSVCGGTAMGAAFNIVLFELLAGIFLCITERLRTAYRIEGTAALVFGLANAYVVRFRTNPLVPWDILSWRIYGKCVRQL